MISLLSTAFYGNLTSN